MNTIEQKPFNVASAVSAKDMGLLCGLTEHDPLWVHFDNDCVATKFPWWRYQELDKFGPQHEQAENWLKEGYAIGLMPRNGLYVLHFNTQDISAVHHFIEELMRKAKLPGQSAPMVGSKKFGIIAFLALPTGFDGTAFRNRVWGIPIGFAGATMDIVFGPHAVIPVLGQIRALNLGVSEVIDQWEPLNRWDGPPSVDPSLLAAESCLIRDPTPFMVASGTREQRTEAARIFLSQPQTWMRGLHSDKYTAHVTHPEGWWRQNELEGKVATITNLIVYFGLDPVTAYDLVCETPDPKSNDGDLCWNLRLVAHFGVNTELYDWQVMDMAEHAVDQVPTMGLTALREEQINHELETFEDILNYIKEFPTSEKMTDNECRQSFLRMFHRKDEDVSQEHFNEEIEETRKGGWISLQSEKDANTDRLYYLGISGDSLIKMRERWDYSHGLESYWYDKQEELQETAM